MTYSITKDDIAELLRDPNGEIPIVSQSLVGGESVVSIDPGLVIKKKRGRPRKTDSEKKPKLKVKWAPIEWRIEYDKIVAFSCLGYSNSVVGELTGFSAQHVSNVLNLPEAKAMRTIIRERFVKEQVDAIPERLGKLQIKATDRISEFLNNEKYFEKMPGAVVDRSFKLLESIGILKGRYESELANVINTTNNTQNIQNIANTIIIPTQQMIGIKDALKLAMEVDQKEMKILSHPTLLERKVSNG